jgi:O-antigen/teichoic acid export membrane protein
MRNLRSIKSIVKARLGDLWWYTLILFVTQRLGDVINAFVGLWLVPKYVPQEELGAVLPLTNIGSLLGLPLMILMIPFMKFLNKYMTHCEYGKVKKLLRDVFVFSGLLFLFISVVAHFLMPFVFERMRVENGRLSMLIIASGIISSLAPLFGTALQALKKFQVLSVTVFLSSIVRLVTMIIFLPIRGLSGYFVGQIAPNIFNMGVALLALHKHLGRKTKMVSYWREDWKLILGYTKWIALLYVTGTLQGTVESFVIRHRLPDMDSAGFYMISRFAEIATYVGMSVMIVMFPLVSERSERGQVDNRHLKQSILSSLIFGIVISCLLFFIGKWAMTLVHEWRVYIAYQPLMIWLGVLFTLRSCINCFTFHEMALSRFSGIKWISAISFVEALFLYSMFASSLLFSFFPNAFTEQLSTLKVETLPGVLCIMTIFIIIQFYIVIHAIFLHKSINKVNYV